MRVYDRCSAIVGFVMTFENQCAAQSISPAGMVLNWADVPRELPQGKIRLKLSLRNETGKEVALSEWVPEGWGPAFSVTIRKRIEGAKGVLLSPVPPRSIVKRESITLTIGEIREITGTFALNNEPGDYELV